MYSIFGPLTPSGMPSGVPAKVPSMGSPVMPAGPSRSANGSGSTPDVARPVAPRPSLEYHLTAPDDDDEEPVVLSDSEAALH